MPSLLAAALQPGSELREYVIDSVLGESSFGITYQARDSRDAQSVAIREYFPREFCERAADGQAKAAGSAQEAAYFRWGLDKFVDEATALVAIDHPNIVVARRWFSANGTAYLVMDYCEGESLDALLQREQTLGEPRLREFLKPLLDGLEAVHAAGLLHRDVRPRNIILRSDGSPVLLGFGAARQELGLHSRSADRLAIGSYAAVEQYATRSTLLGPWTDIYGMAATLYHCVAGAEAQCALDRQLQDELEPAVRAAAGNYAEALLQAIDHGMALKREERPQTVAAWRDELFGAPEIEPPVKPAAREPDPNKTTRKMLVALAVAGVVAYGLSQMQRQRPAEKATLPVLAADADKQAGNAAQTPPQTQPQTPTPTLPGGDSETRAKADRPNAKERTPAALPSGRKSGPGRQVFDMPFRGGSFSGTVVNDLPNGHGEYRRADGIVDAGHFVNGSLNGEGLRTYPDGVRHKGSFIRNECVGFGIRAVPPRKGVDGHSARFAASWRDCANGSGTYISEGGYNGSMKLRDGVWLTSPRAGSRTEAPAVAPPAAPVAVPAPVPDPTS